MQISILVICAHQEILGTIMRLLHQQENWQATGVLNCDEARQQLAQHEFDLVLLGSGIEASKESEFTAWLGQYHPKIRIVEHYGGGSGLLTAEIHGVLHSL